jgi:hypothetical protein
MVDYPGVRIGPLMAVVAIAAGAASCEEPVSCTLEECIPLRVNLRFAIADNEPGEEVAVDVVTDWGERTFSCAVAADGFFENCHDSAEGTTLNTFSDADATVLEFTIGRSGGGSEMVEVTARIGDAVLFTETFNPVYQDLGEINGEGCGTCERAATIERDIAR